MSEVAGASVLGVCLTVVACLVLVLRHLEKLLLTTKQADELKDAFGAMHDQQQDTIRLLARTVEENASKLSALSNRVR